jgi:hypothetical protein
MTEVLKQIAKPKMYINQFTLLFIIYTGTFLLFVSFFFFIIFSV